MIGSALALVGLAALTALLPAILSAFGGRFWFAGTLASRFDAPVSIDSLSLSWTSPQRIEGLSIEGAHSKSTGDQTRLLDVRNATVQTTLFDLLFTDKPLVLEIDGARVSFRRHESGRFNVDGLFGGDDVGDAIDDADGGGVRSGAGILSLKKVVESQAAAGWLPNFEREVVIRLANAHVEYDDRFLESRVAMTNLNGELRIGPDESSLHFSAEVETPAGKDTPAGRVECRVTASGWETTLADLEVEGAVELASLDLRPYAPIIREYGKFAPPEDLVHAEVRAHGADGMLEVGLDVDAGVVGISGATCEVPLESHARVAEIIVPCVVDLVPTLALVEESLEMPQGSRLEGRIVGTLRAKAPLSVADVRDKGWAAFEGLNFDFDASCDEFVLVMPLGNDNPEVISGLPSDDATKCRVSISGDLTGFVGSHQLPPKYIRIDGDMELTGDFRCGELTAERVATSFSITGGKLEFTGATAMVNGGELTGGEALLDLESVPPIYELKVGLDGVGASYEMSTLLAYVLPFLGLDESRGELKGVVDGNLHLAGRGFRAEEVERNLQGGGSVRLRRGLVRGSHVFRRVSGAFGHPVEEVPFEEMGARFDIAHGRVRTADVFVRKDEGDEASDLGLEGVTFFDRRLDHSVRLAALQRTVGVRRARRALRDFDRGIRQAEGLLAGQSWPVRLTGTIANPVISFDPVPGVSVPMDDVLEYLLSH